MRTGMEAVYTLLDIDREMCIRDSVLAEPLAGGAGGSDHPPAAGRGGGHVQLRLPPRR